MQNLSPQQVVSTPLSEFGKLPDRAGVYILKNSEDTPVYVGKATSIKNRVLAHLRPKFDDPIGQVLKDQIKSADYIFTQTPIEALILENVLIKRHKPRYNIRLKDDKSYPYIKISNEPVPRILVTRRVENDGASYFGPYGNARAARRTVKYLRRIFPIRDCTLPLDWEKKFKPCIDLSIGLCTGPCNFSILRRDYDRNVKMFQLFLEGKLVQLSKVMYDEMWKASESQDFEKASKIRDNIKSLETTALKQRITFQNQKRDKDVVTIAREGSIAAAIVFQVRNGNVVGRDKFVLDGVNDSSLDAEIISAFIKQHYASLEARISELPHEVVVPVELPDHEEVLSLLNNLGRADEEGIKLSDSTSSEENRKLMKLAQENAVMVLKEEESKDEVKKRERLRALKELKEKLELGKIPKRIECYDISNIHGDEAVGAMTVFVDGFPEKSQYRKFKIKSVKGIDDYKMMAEMLNRRFKRLADAGVSKSWAREQPDLVIIDGGRGHLNAALDQMHSDGIFGIPTVSLAKKEELIFLPNRVHPVRLPRDSEALYVVQHIRDEAHRFGITYHRKLRSKKLTHSALDEITGIGRVRKRNLLAHFGSIEAIRRSSPEEIAQVAKISSKLAGKIIATLG
ncbi:MAG: excinuclease ABC subunit UvrC [Nitrososphaerota archaeon]|nr:excinuclease ABC subunit UvrC [Nitrososphaerota archaeon]